VYTTLLYIGIRTHSIDDSCLECVHVGGGVTCTSKAVETFYTRHIYVRIYVCAQGPDLYMTRL